MEHCMQADDRPAFPMCFFIEIGATGELDQAAFREALQAALQRHPLLQSVMRRSWRGLVWQPGPAPRVDWNPVDDWPAPADRFLNIRQESGLRIRVAARDHQPRIRFQFHHAATDGLGAMHFIGDLLAIYGRATAAAGTEMPVLSGVDPAVLTIRGRIWESGHGIRGLLRRWLYRAWQVLTVSPLALNGRSVRDAGATKVELPAPFQTRILDRHQLKRLLAHATEWNVTLNELMATAMLQTASAWSARRGSGHPRDAIRVCIPVSLRSANMDAMPAANCISYLMLTHRRSLMTTPALLKYVASECREVMNNGESGLVLLSMRVASAIPGLLAVATRLPLRLSSAVLASVGDVKRQFRSQFPLHAGRCVAGSLTIDSLLGAAPVRPGTHVASSFGRYAGQLFINVNCAPQAFSESDAVSFTDLFVRHILALTENDDRSPDRDKQPVATVAAGPGKSVSSDTAEVDAVSPRSVTASVLPDGGAA
jgi:hypothetical protein